MAGCTRCDGTGFLNTHQLPEEIDGYDWEAVARWLEKNEDGDHDVCECDCCGDCETPGEHGYDDDPVYDCM